MTTDIASAVRKIRLRLVTPLLALLFLSTIDRVNVSFAALQMNADVGLTPQEYGFGVSIFFIGYILVQLPSLWLLQRIGMRLWLFAITIVWGLAATSMAFVDSKESFYALRMVLGIAEGGYAPGLTYYIASWMPKRYRAGAISNVMLAVPASVVIGGPLSGWLMSIDNPFGWAGWRWMLMLEGLPTILLSIAALWLFADWPRDARWLTTAERRELEEELAREQSTQAATRVSGWSLLGSGRLWGATACWFALMAGAHAVLYWLPQVIRHFSAQTSDIEVGAISALPWIAVGAGMLLNAWHSDRRQERYLHVALTAIACGAFMWLTALAGGGAVALLWLLLASFFMGASQGTFWTIPPTFLGPAALAAGIGVINMCGNLAGLIVPAAVGSIRERTGAFDLPLYFISIVLVLGGAAVLLVRSRLNAAPRMAGAPADTGG